MNQKYSDHFGDDKLDAQVKKVLDPLKHINTPSTLRSSNLKAINRALDDIKPVAANQSKKWWQRRIAIPYPIAAGFAIAFLLSTISQFNIFTSSSIEKETDNKPVQMINNSIERNKDNAPYYYETSMYVCGLGEIGQVKGYQY